MAQVTVVIPLYNKAGQVERALRSVLTQSFQDFSILVVDDGSTDGSRDIAGRVGDERIRLITQDNRGVSAARNRGAKEASTERIVFLDADDELNPDFLNIILELQRRYAQAGLWATSFEVQKEGGAMARPKIVGDVACGLLEDYFGVASHGTPFCVGSVMTTRRVLAAVGGFPEGETLAEDFDTWARIALRHSIAFAPAAMVITHTDALYRLSECLGFTGEETCLMRTLRAALACNDLAHRESVERYLAKHLLKVARHCIKQDRGERARELILETFGLRSFRLDASRLWLRSFWRPHLRALAGWLPAPGLRAARSGDKHEHGGELASAAQFAPNVLRGQRVEHRQDALRQP